MGSKCIDPAGLLAAGAPYSVLSERDQSGVDALLKSQMRRNTYDPVTGIVHISAERPQAIARVASHFEGVFGNHP